jgi:hypothetical protein
MAESGRDARDGTPLEDASLFYEAAEMRTVKANTVECIVLDDGEKLKQYTLISRSGTSWQGQLFLESIKAMNGAWPTSQVDPNGNHVLRLPSIDEVVSRAVEIVENVVSTMEKHGWSVETPTAADLIDHGGGRPGFMVNSQHGKADTGGASLPGTK